MLGAARTVSLGADAACVELLGATAIPLVAIVTEESGAARGRGGGVNEAAAEGGDRGALVEAVAGFGGVPSSARRGIAKLLAAEDSRHRKRVSIKEKEKMRKRERKLIQTAEGIELMWSNLGVREMVRAFVLDTIHPRVSPLPNLLNHRHKKGAHG